MDTTARKRILPRGKPARGSGLMKWFYDGHFMMTAATGDQAGKQIGWETK